MKLFYYTQKENVAPTEDGQPVEPIKKTGYSFDLDSVVLTYPDSNGLSVVLNRNADKLNPVEYEYKIDPQTKQRVPVKVKRFEITSEPIVINLTEPEEIAQFFNLTDGPKYFNN